MAETFIVRNTEARKVASRENGRKGGRPREPVRCTCNPWPDGRHQSRCRIYQAEYKRRKRAAKEAQ